jgi:hypothetical protein
MIDQPDPYPRELLDVWPLHDARQELLEEIVSQPGNGQTSTRRIVVPVGIAAALLLVVGGAWAAISAGGNDQKDDDTVAASVVSTAVDPTSEPATGSTGATASDTATAPTDKPRHDGVRRGGGRTGRAVTLRNLEQCLRTLSTRTGEAKGELRLRRLEHPGRHYKVYVVRKDHRVIVVDGQCRSRLVKGGRVGRH